MQIAQSKREKNLAQFDLLVLPVSLRSLRQKGGDLTFAALDKLSNGRLFSEMELFEFKPQANKSLLVQLSSPNLPRNVLLVGWEKSSGYEVGLRLRKLGNSIFDTARSRRAAKVLVQCAELEVQDALQVSAFLEGVMLSAYSFLRYKKEQTKFEIKQLTLLSPKKVALAGIERAQIVSDAVLYTRDLVNTPAVDCTPGFLAKEARRIAKEQKLGITIFSKAELRKMKADLMLSVFDSSNEDPFLIKLHYRPAKKSKRKIALVGKGVTFDTGGLCIKSGPGMYEMKNDMAGAGAVLATMEAIARLKPGVEVIAFCPVTENMINAMATKPGNVVRALNGKTVEILNTDAEGRLILGDALVLAEREKVDCIVDVATLTGSVAGFLGSEYSGLFSSDDKLASRLLAAAEMASERLCRLPLAPEYRERLKSPVADIKNIGGAEAGGILAALFLSEFVESAPWAHLDIAGPALIDSDRGFNRRGATGVAVRTLIQFIEG